MGISWRSCSERARPESETRSSSSSVKLYWSGSPGADTSEQATSLAGTASPPFTETRRRIGSYSRNAKALPLPEIPSSWTRPTDLRSMRMSAFWGFTVGLS